MCARIAALFCLILSVFPAYVSSQHFLDSLKKQLSAAKEDTNRVILLNRITEYCSEPEIGMYSLPAIKLAKKLNFKTGLAHAYNNLGFYYRNAGLNDSSIYCMLQSFRISRELKKYYEAGDALNNLGYVYQQLGDRKASMQAFDSCMYYYQKSGRKRADWKRSIAYW
jgi:two-component system, NtrC family, sensor kinase